MSKPLNNLLKNPSDPLKGGPNAGRELAQRFAKMADQFSREDVLAATMSLMLDVVRQTQPEITGAHIKLSEIAQRAHTILDAHYDPVTGKRRHVFAFDQTILMQFTDDRKK